MPNVKKGQSKQQYVARAMNHMIKKEGLDPKHAYAKAQGMWRQHQKGKK